MNTRLFITWAQSNGWSGRPSTDGLWMIGDRNGETGQLARDNNKNAASLPDYASQATKDFYTANGYITHQQANELVSVKASSGGASDGYIAPGDISV
jgi:hypothetical protein